MFALAKLSIAVNLVIREKIGQTKQLEISSAEKQSPTVSLALKQSPIDRMQKIINISIFFNFYRNTQ